MRYIKYIILLFVLILIDSTILSSISIFDIKPNLFLIFIFYICINEGSFAGVLAGFFSGLFIDVYTPQYLGSGAFIKSILGYFLGFFDYKVIKLEDRFKILILFAAAIIHEITILLFRSSNLDTILDDFYKLVIPSALYTSLFGALFFMFISKLKR